MRIIFMALAIFSLTSCEKESQKAEARYRMVEKSGASKAELCEELGRVTAAYLDEGDEASYRLWKGNRDATCMLARYK